MANNVPADWNGQALRVIATQVITVGFPLLCQGPHHRLRVGVDVSQGRSGVAGAGGL